MFRVRPPFAVFLALLLAILVCSVVCGAQDQAQDQSRDQIQEQSTSAPKRLILTDGSYQIVTQYKRLGDRVRYFSAEREQWEELPANLVDWPATEKWAREHTPGTSGVSAGSSEAAAIDKEEQEEKAERMSRTPEVSPGLRLPDQEGVWALDTFRNQPELVSLAQNTGDVNPRTGHSVLRSALNPMGGLKQTIEIPGAVAKVKLHVNDPAIYVSLTDEGDETADPGSLTVQTRNAPPLNQAISSPSSQYAIVRVEPDLRHDSRYLGEIKFARNGDLLSRSEDVIPTKAEILPGRHWLKLTPSSPLEIGNYALMEILGAGEVNTSIWDFDINPAAPEQKDSILPLDRSLQ